MQEKLRFDWKRLQVDNKKYGDGSLKPYRLKLKPELLQKPILVANESLIIRCYKIYEQE